MTQPVEVPNERQDRSKIQPVSILPELAAAERNLTRETAARLITGEVPLSDVTMSPDLRARPAIEKERGAAYTDAEWAEAKRNLVSFMLIAIDWQEARPRL